MNSADDVNNAVREINRILYYSAFAVFGKTVLKRSPTYVKRHDNDWFNQNCASARQDFNYARNFYQRHPTDANRQRYILARNRYNRTKRLAVTNYKRAKGQVLCEFAKSDPRKFWSAFKPMNKNKCLADSDLLINHFEQLLGGNPPDIYEEVLNLIETNSFLNDIVIDSLDTEISEDEILQSINKLKTGKSAGNERHALNNKSHDSLAKYINHLNMKFPNSPKSSYEVVKKRDVNIDNQNQNDHLCFSDGNEMPFLRKATFETLSVTNLAHLILVVSKKHMQILFPSGFQLA
ncbi:unnamed protein product [Mytilus coruscus]|uniref:Uncharacterized protein n=1 Tax=Mytilus coruscus TaxID=42192 RepID=A0A6J8AW69_MYTCO|nr:unnamed protein product [Mytilus coruscus]